MVRAKRRPKSGRDLKRRAAFRSEPDRVLIVTEGSKTEPAYFRMLITELGLTTAQVTIAGDGGSAPVSVVQKAKRLLTQDDDFEQVYCIFDRDCHQSYDLALGEVRALATSRTTKDKTVLAVTSVPCFELWYQLHVSDSRSPYAGQAPAQDLIADLKKTDHFRVYDKKGCDSFYNQIAPHRQAACRRAERFLDEAKAEAAREYHENPSTRVHLVVKALTEIAEKQKSEKP